MDKQILDSITKNDLRGFVLLSNKEIADKIDNLKFS